MTFAYTVFYKALTVFFESFVPSSQVSIAAHVHTACFCSKPAQKNHPCGLKTIVDVARVLQPICKFLKTVYDLYLVGIATHVPVTRSHPFYLLSSAQSM